VGQITGDEFFGEMQRSLGFRGSFEEFAVAFSDIFRENTPMIELMRVLKRRFPVYLLSNTNEIHIGFVEQRHPFLREFDGYHYSFRVGARKPDAQYYRGFVEQYGFAPSDVAFVDDILPNVDAARAVGMCGVHYQNAAQARAELLRLAGE
jgi:putative hydrolase of the HAD superfamily